MNKLTILCGATLISLMLLESGHSEEEKTNNRYNVLMICVDDLRAELGCYGVDTIQTPHINQLAKSALVFNNHFVQVPTCGSSRYALLTGRRPV